jgi:hypothetical protein
MSHGERAALLHVLRLAQPPSALEVGTSKGGSLQHIFRHAQTTYSIDIEPEVRKRLAPEMPNVEFLTGDSKELIGTVLRHCATHAQPLGFALIDGDHTYAGVKADLVALLAIRPERPLWVLMHDSTNPGCRAGIAQAPWAANPHVHMVDLDFVTGVLSDDPAFERQLWGGFAIALLLPQPRTHSLVIAASAAKNYDALWRASSHYPSLANYVAGWLRIKRRGLARRMAER